MFEQKYEEWLQKQIDEEKNPRRRERLERGLSYGTVEFLRRIWYPKVGHFDDLNAEWEVIDFHSGYRYLDLSYMPGGAKGAIEIQDYTTHARDLDLRRFKDLCKRHCLLALDEWIFLPIALPAIKDEPQLCQQLVLSFIGKFITTIDIREQLGYLEVETLRHARRLLRPFTPMELAEHLRVTSRHARRISTQLVDLRLLVVASGQRRARAYQLRV